MKGGNHLEAGAYSAAFRVQVDLQVAAASSALPAPERERRGRFLSTASLAKERELTGTRPSAPLQGCRLERTYTVPFALYSEFEMSLRPSALRFQLG